MSPLPWLISGVLTCVVIGSSLYVLWSHSKKPETLLCGVGPDSAGYSLEFVNDLMGNVSEIHIPSYSGRRYRITKTTPSTYEAEELDPKQAPEAAGTLYLERLTGRLTTVEKISFAAVSLMQRFCDGQLTKDACVEEMNKINGGNLFACFETKDCPHYKNNSNVLATFVETCSRAERKF
jgi:hypothetical protein